MITITLANTLNISIQPRDIVYAVTLSGGQAGRNFIGNKPVPIGEVINNGVDHANNKVTFDDSAYGSYTWSSDHYFFFSKNKSVNTSGITGYYALTEYRNYSKKEAEIFATGTEYAPSSK